MSRLRAVLLHFPFRAMMTRPSQQKKISQETLASSAGDATALKAAVRNHLEEKGPSLGCGQQVGVDVGVGISNIHNRSLLRYCHCQVGDSTLQGRGPFPVSLHFPGEGARRSASTSSGSCTAGGQEPRTTHDRDRKLLGELGGDRRRSANPSTADELRNLCDGDANCLGQKLHAPPRKTHVNQRFSQRFLPFLDFKMTKTTS